MKISKVLPGKPQRLSQRPPKKEWVAFPPLPYREPLPPAKTITVMGTAYRADDHRLTQALEEYRDYQAELDQDRQHDYWMGDGL